VTDLQRAALRKLADLGKTHHWLNAYECGCRRHVLEALVKKGLAEKCPPAERPRSTGTASFVVDGWYRITEAGVEALSNNTPSEENK
jgi:hypothetical protein